MWRAYLMCLLLTPCLPASASPFFMLAGTAPLPPGTLPEGARWQGLFCQPRCELRAVTAQARIETVEHIDEAVDVEFLLVDGEPLALFADFDFTERWLDGAPPAAGIVGDAGAIRIGSQLGLVRVVGDDGWQRHFYLHDAWTEQLLFVADGQGDFGDDVYAVVEWVGDLDGDGRLDLIVSIPHEHCGIDQRLFLSSLAGPGDLVGEAAHLKTWRAACGC